MSHRRVEPHYSYYSATLHLSGNGIAFGEIYGSRGLSPSHNLRLAGTLALPQFTARGDSRPPTNLHWPSSKFGTLGRLDLQGLLPPAEKTAHCSLLTAHFTPSPLHAADTSAYNTSIIMAIFHADPTTSSSPRQSLTGTRWHIAGQVTPVTEGFLPALGQVLASRGIRTPREVDTFLNAPLSALA